MTARDTTLPSSEAASSAWRRPVSCSNATPAHGSSLLEREDEVGRHQTGNNSGVIHAGIYYDAGLAEGAAVRRGRAALYEYCDARGIPRRALRQADRRDRARPSCRARRARAARHGQRRARPAARRRDRLRELEPHARGIAALHSPAPASSTSPQVARAYARATSRPAAAGIAARLRGRGRRAAQPASCCATARRDVRARARVFCAGALADRLAVARRRRPRPADRPVPRQLPAPAARARGARSLADLPGARPAAAVPRRPPDAPPARRRADRPDRAARAARALARLAGDVAHDAALLAHRR